MDVSEPRMDVDWPQIGTDSAQIRGEVDDKVFLHKKLTEGIIGLAFEVHRELGPGFLEKVYQTALVQEFTLADIPCVAEAEVPVSYKGRSVGIFYSDILVDGRVICEIKAVGNLTLAHQAQLIHYLKATGIRVGLLLNFGSRSLQVKRMVL